jgi:hypothetical protein
MQPICRDEHQMFCHGICKVNSNQVIWSSQHNFFCEVQSKHVKYYMSQIILISNQNMRSSHHKFLWSPTETYEVHITNFCDRQLKHLKFMSYFFVISNWVIWSHITIFCIIHKTVDMLLSYHEVLSRGGMTHPTPFLFGLSTTPSFISTNLEMDQPMPPLSFWAINHSSFISTNLEMDQPALRWFMTQQGWTCNVFSNPFPGKPSSTSWTIHWPVTTKSWELRKNCLKNG